MFTFFKTGSNSDIGEDYREYMSEFSKLSITSRSSVELYIFSHFGTSKTLY